MDRNEARKAAEVMLAYADGKEIEYKNGALKDWSITSVPTFNWGSNDYRIKPQSKYRPFKDIEECWKEMQKHQPFGWIKDKSDTINYEHFFITCIMESRNDVDKILFTIDGKDLTGKKLFDECVFADGDPFGVKEEEDYEDKRRN